MESKALRGTSLSTLVRAAGAPPPPSTRTKTWEDLPRPSVVPPTHLRQLVRVALLAAAAPGSRAKDPAILWEVGSDSLLVYPARADVRVGDGWLLIELPVACDQTGPTTVVVAFGLAKEAVPGAVVSVERPPRGPSAVVVPWGDALVALAWQSVQLLILRWARGGTQRGVVAGGVAATRRGLSILATPPAGRKVTGLGALVQRRAVATPVEPPAPEEAR